MKIIKFEKLILSSDVLRMGKVIDFAEITIVTGIGNTTGKSSILKSLYHTLGGNVLFEDEWYPLNVKTILYFSVDGKLLHAYRNGNLIAFFENDTLLFSSDSITKGISPYVSKLFDFELPLLLNGKNNVQEQAIPAFLYLPFYIDQDSGWRDYYSSFNGLGMFFRWQDTFKNFHTGIRPKEYYIANNSIKSESDKINNLQNDYGILSRTREKIKLTLDKRQLGVNINIDEFKADLDKLVIEYQKLAKSENNYRTSLFVLNEQKHELQVQIEAIQEQLDATDHELNLSELNKEVVCPKCGSVHESSIYREYALLNDKEDAKNIIDELKKQIANIIHDLAEQEMSLNDIMKLAKTIKENMKVIKSEISLKEVMDSYASDQASGVIDSELEENSEKQKKIVALIAEYEKEKKKYADRKRTKRIKDYYIEQLGNYLHDLAVSSANIKAYRTKFTPPSTKLKTGSRSPRQMLAVYYAFVNTVYQNTTASKMPIVIDSPKQQEQDAINSDQIVKFTIANKPTDAQLILATLNYKGDRDNSIKVHELNIEKGLLNTEDYIIFKDEFDQLDMIAFENKIAIEDKP